MLGGWVAMTNGQSFRQQLSPFKHFSIASHFGSIKAFQNVETAYSEN
jgi:hypothetical protein